MTAKNWVRMLALTLRSFNIHLTQSKWLSVQLGLAGSVISKELTRNWENLICNIDFEGRKHPFSLEIETHSKANTCRDIFTRQLLFFKQIIKHTLMKFVMTFSWASIFVL